MLVGGLAVLLARLLLLRLFDGHTSIAVVVAAATQIMLDAIQTLSLVMAVVPIAAIMVAVLLIKPARTVSR